MIKEIGSEFWISEPKISSTNELPYWLKSWGNYVLTTSGRGAMSLLLQNVQPKYKTVLLPSYICDAVITPFERHGYTCLYYELNENLEAVFDNYILENDIGVFLHMGYYGFPTNSSLDHIISRLKEKSVIIIEDITHTLFSDFERSAFNNYYIASIRKWIGIPSGGLLASSEVNFNYDLPIDDPFVNMRKKALELKTHYVNGTAEVQKESYLKLFEDAEEYLDNHIYSYTIDDLSAFIINGLDNKMIVNRRKENFNFLLKELKDLYFLKSIFTELPDEVCPMFYPVYVKTDRVSFRKYLIDNKIYCPIHWPVPNQVKDQYSNRTKYIYNTILSIPCDQRYGIEDMTRIIEVVGNYVSR